MSTFLSMANFIDERYPKTSKIFKLHKLNMLIQEEMLTDGRAQEVARINTYHDALTQVCYSCMKVRSTIKR